MRGPRESEMEQEVHQIQQVWHFGTSLIHVEEKAAGLVPHNQILIYISVQVGKVGHTSSANVNIFKLVAGLNPNSVVYAKSSHYKRMSQSYHGERQVQQSNVSKKRGRVGT